MARLKPSDSIRTDDYRSIRSAEHQTETNDCTVIATVKACGVDYKIAHAALKAQGRIEGKGTSIKDLNSAIESLGFKVERRASNDFISRYPGCHASAIRNVTTHHPHRFNGVWADGKTYLFYTRRHVAAVINGVNTDWCRTKAHRVGVIFEVIKIEAAPMAQGA